jgi:tetratricopeptide (TPR) repeat protein
MMLDSTVSKYILGTAACLHRQKDFINAANLYLLCGSYEPNNPMPHYHSADCYIQLGALSLAILSLQMAIQAAADQPQYAILKERAELLKAGLTKEMEAQMKDLNTPESSTEEVKSA